MPDLTSMFGKASIVDQFGTGYVRTTVHTDGAGAYVWTRRPGPDRPVPLCRPGRDLRQAITSAPRAGVRLTLPDPDPRPVRDDSLTFRAPGPVSVAKLLLSNQVRQAGAIAGTLRDTAAALFSLHVVAPRSGHKLRPPNGPRRLASWLGSGAGPRATGRLHAVAVPTLGVHRVRLIAKWCAEFDTSIADPVLLHGAVGTGILVPARPAGMACLLTGEELAVGRPAFDVGWLIGELIELRECARRQPHSALQAHDYDRLIAAVLTGYGEDLDHDEVARCAAVRFLTHTHDYCAYMGWDESMLGFLHMVADTIDEALAGTLLRMRPVDAGTGRT